MDAIAWDQLPLSAIQMEPAFVNPMLLAESAQHVSVDILDSPTALNLIIKVSKNAFILSKIDIKVSFHVTSFFVLTRQIFVILKLEKILILTETLLSDNIRTHKKYQF